MALKSSLSLSFTLKRGHLFFIATKRMAMMRAREGYDDDDGYARRNRGGEAEEEGQEEMTEENNIKQEEEGE
jgi:hypothetical protein